MRKVFAIPAGIVGFLAGIAQVLVYSGVSAGEGMDMAQAAGAEHGIALAVVGAPVLVGGFLVIRLRRGKPAAPAISAANQPTTRRTTTRERRFFGVFVSRVVEVVEEFSTSTMTLAVAGLVAAVIVGALYLRPSSNRSNGGSNLVSYDSTEQPADDRGEATRTTWFITPDVALDADEENGSYSGIPTREAVISATEAARATTVASYTFDNFPPGETAMNGPVEVEAGWVAVGFAINLRVDGFLVDPGCTVFVITGPFAGTLAWDAGGMNFYVGEISDEEAVALAYAERPSDGAGAAFCGATAPVVRLGSGFGGAGTSGTPIP